MNRDEPTAPGRVHTIHVSPARGIPMRSVEAVSLEPGHGIPGDRYHGSRHRHVSVQSLEALATAAADLERPIPPESTRRNITVTGIDVPARPGERMTIGAAVLEVVRVAAPCRLLDDEIGDGARVALRRRAGSILRVIGAGSIAVGDPVTIDSLAETER